MKDCPACGSANIEGTLVCEGCGKGLHESTAHTTLTVNPFDSYAQSREMNVLVTGRGTTLRIETLSGVRPIPIKRGVRAIIGRSDLSNEFQADLDLTVFGGMENGVSRQHAVIDCTDDTPVLIDLGSRNGTFLNGLALKPHQIYALRDGDEVRFGKLIAHVSLG